MPIDVPKAHPGDARAPFARTRTRAPVAALIAAALVAVAASGCRHKSKTPEEAYRRFAAAVNAGDGGALFDALDQSARWDWMTIQKWQREAYDIVLSNYPEGPERERERRRFEHGATAASARALFAAEIAPVILPLLQPLALGASSFAAGPADGRADAVLASGARVAFARADNGGWGFAGLDARAADDKNRVYHDLEVVRSSAADYERAAARAAK